MVPVSREFDEFEAYRRMTPLERLLLASRLYAAARDLRFQVERSNHPDWSDERIASHVRQVFCVQLPEVFQCFVAPPLRLALAMGNGA
jgi:hypothetical protein